MLYSGERTVLRCQIQAAKVTVTFKIKKKVSYGQRVGVLGESMGKWAPEKALMLEWGAGDQWVSAPVQVERSAIPCCVLKKISNIDGEYRW